MRVTNQMIFNLVTQSLSRQGERMFKLQRSISSGKRVNEPSDDPLGMTRILDFRSSLASMDQYEKNIDHGLSWERQTESSLYDVNQELSRTKELVLSQVTGTATDETRQATAEEVSVIFEHVIQLANTRFGEHYIFSGFKTDTAAFVSTSDYTYRGDTGAIQTEIARNQKVTINLTGTEVFTGGPVNILQTLDNVVTDLRNNDVSGLQADIDALDTGLEHILAKLGEIGAKTNQLETTKDSLQDLKLNATELLSELEDTDFPKALAELSMQETIYQASLASSAQLLQTSLLDFLG
jgi:flagellar hook-associated protein 3 FlgL